jgi:hypothetical protein
MLQVLIQVFNTKALQKIVPSGFVYLADAAYQFLFAHTLAPVIPKQKNIQPDDSSSAAHCFL